MSTIVGFTADLTLVTSNSVKFNDTWSNYTDIALDKFYNKKVNLIVDGEYKTSNFTPYKYEITKEIYLNNPGINKSIKCYLTFEFDKDLNITESEGSVNLITVNYGVHLQLAKFAITDKLKTKYGITHKLLDKGLKYTMVILANRVHYDSQTKTRLVSIDNLEDPDWYQFHDEIDKIFDDDFEVVREHVDALNELAKSYESLSKRDFIKSMITINSESGNRDKSYQPVKLLDASSEDRSRCELFLAEGASAAGTIVKTRDPSIHAIMPMRGVALNSVYMDFEQLSENVEIMDIISAIGTGVDDLYDLNALRYDKIIIATDADSDGYHIAALLLGLFAAHMRFLVEDERIYILESPFYKQDGKYYYQSDLSGLDKSKPFERFKGLGSLKANSAEGIREINEIFINKDTRRLIKVIPEDFEKAIAAVGNSHTRKILMESRNLV